MFLSHLLISTGNDPDRPRPGRSWLRNRYHVHQRLCMAFPSDPRQLDDPEFLAPYSPDDFPEQRHLADRHETEVGHDTLQQVHSQRNTEAGFLFRIDPLPNGRAIILVLSALEPNWAYAFHNAEYLLAAPPQRTGALQVNIKPGERFGFRLVANPTKKILTIPKKKWDGMSQEEQTKAKTRHGQRMPVPSNREIEDWRAKHPGEETNKFIRDKLIEWLSNWRPIQNGQPAASAGFIIDKDATVVQPGYVYFNKGGKDQGRRLYSVRYDGILTVTDPEAFRLTQVRGIGPAKGFGCGLLSVARG